MREPHRHRSFLSALLNLTAFSFCFLIYFLSTPSTGVGAELIGLDTTSNPEETKIILQLDGSVAYSEHRLPAAGVGPDRCYVDLYRTRLAPGLPKLVNVDDDHVISIRAGIHGNMSRVAVSYFQNRACTIENQDEKNRIILSVRGIASSPAQPEPPLMGAPITGSLGGKAQFRQQTTPVVTVDTEPEPKVSPLFGDALPTMSSNPDRASLSVVPEQPLAVWGRVWGFGAYDLKKDPAEDQKLTRLRSRLGLQHESRWHDLFDIQGQAAVEWDVLDYDNQEAGTDNDLNLYEAYLRLSGARWDLSVGRQRVRWGKSDQLSPLDSINPEDLRQFMTLDLEERKIPSWLARLRLHGSTFSVEAIVDPWFEKSELEYFDSDWALYRNLRQTIMDHPQLPQSLKDYAAGLRVHEREPANSLENIAGAVRLAWQADNGDFALSYRYGWESLPTITNFPVKNVVFSGDPASNPAEFLGASVLTSQAVEARFRRQQIAGFEWETVLDPVGFRGEIAYIDQVSLLGEDLTSRSKEVGHLVAGIDYTSVDDWYFNLQTSWYRIFGYDESILYFERDNLSLLGEIRKTLWRGNLELSTRYNYTLTDGSSYLQPAITLKYFPNTELEAGVMVFGGDGDTLLGSYDQTDQAYAQVKISF